MFDALVFSTVNALEFSEVRRNVIRIPEVITRVREAQTIWDQTTDRNLDLVNFISSDDQVFLGNLRLKNLATAVIHLGLLDRFLKTEELPRWLLGLSNGDAPIRVASREASFDELVRSSYALNSIRPQQILGFSGLPLLSGVSLAEFTVLNKDENGFKPVIEHEMDLRRALTALIDGAKPKKVVVLGPGHSHIQHLMKELGGGKIEVGDSVAMDPVLGWFYAPAPDTLALAVQ